MNNIKLKRELNLLDVFCIATGAMISSGLFILPGLAHAQAGPAVVISYMIAGLLAMTGMLSQAELVSAMPKSGGTYFYVTRSMGPALGTIDGLLEWMSISLKSSFALVGMAAFAALIVDLDPRFIALLFCLLFLLLNYIGAKEAGRVQVGIVIVLLILLVLYVARGIFAVDMRNFMPFMPHGIGAVFSTSGFVFISYGGIIKIASIAEEVKSPERVVPLGMILSLLCVCCLYTLVVFVTAGVLGAEQLDNSLTPISDGAAVFMGHAGQVLLGIAAILAFISTANAGIMAASRYPMALSRDHLLPGSFGRLHPRRKTPYIAIAVTGIIMIAVLFLNLYVLVEVASTVLILTFIFSCVCVIIMRESGIRNYRPKFRAPLYPWVQIAGIFGCWLLIINMGKQALFLGSLFFAGGLAVFWMYGRMSAKKDFALLHLIEKAAARELIGISLESELRDIIRERDNITEDRFDRVIKGSVVLDIEDKLPVEEFFGLVAGKIAGGLNVPDGTVFDLLKEREEQASTVLGPGLAIPHIIVKGEHTFTILLARGKKGIIFKGEEKPVHMAFVIAGSADERDFHLRALSAIAQIVQDPEFEKRWMSAEGEEALRDTVLEAERKRQ
ncbi:MAG: amino acid permease [Candidatus Omnitrophota bacterium]